MEESATKIRLVIPKTFRSSPGVSYDKFTKTTNNSYDRFNSNSFDYSDEKPQSGDEHDIISKKSKCTTNTTMDEINNQISLLKGKSQSEEIDIEANNNANID